MSALQDDNSPGLHSRGLRQWQEIKMLYPNIPLTVAAFENTRRISVEDSPAEFRSELERLSRGHPVHGKT